MGNDCENYIEITSTNKNHIESMGAELTTIGDNGCYGYRDIVINDNSLTARGTTKWSPPLDMYHQWIQTYEGIQLYALYKEEFLHFAGKLENEDQKHVDFSVVTSNDVRSASEGLLFELNDKLHLAEHMDTEGMNDN